MVTGMAKKRQTIRALLSLIVRQTFESVKMKSLKSVLGLVEQEQAKDTVEDFG